jgi:hypothetical protein
MSLARGGRYLETHMQDMEDQAHVRNAMGNCSWLPDMQCRISEMKYSGAYDIYRHAVLRSGVPSLRTVSPGQFTNK